MKSRSVFIILMIFASSVTLFAQMANRLKGERLTEAKFIGIPMISYNRNVEFIVGGFGGFYYPISLADTISPPSFSGAAAMYTTNGTGAAMGFSSIYLFEDFLRVKVAGGVGKVNFQYFNEDVGLEGGFIQYTSTAGLFVISPLFRLVKGWYLGPDFSWLNVATEFEGLPAASDRRTYVSLGAAGEFDSRLSTTYPLDGSYNTFRIRRYAGWLGSASEYIKLRLEFNRYMLLEASSILALRASVQAALGVVPFEAQTVVGQGKDIRGYSEGKYRGDQVYAIQGEYRWNFSPPFGAVGFVGFALPVTGGESVTFSSILPGIGAGFRFTMITEIHANVGVDVAVGRDDWGLYFRIGEAF